MKPNLSFQAFAATLAALGASTMIAACGGSPDAKAPVGGTEVSAPSKTSGGHASCSANGCGAKKDDANANKEKATQGSCSAGSCGAKTAPAAGEAKKDEPKAEPAKAAASPEPAKATASPEPAKAAASPTPTTPPKAAAKPKAGGQASCGAGTCSAKK